MKLGDGYIESTIAYSLEMFEFSITKVFFFFLSLTMKTIMSLNLGLFQDAEQNSHTKVLYLFVSICNI